jgi:hypothetical protein
MRLMAAAVRPEAGCGGVTIGSANRPERRCAAAVDARRQPVTGNHAIGKEDHPIGVRRGDWIMGHHHDGLPADVHGLP